MFKNCENCGERFETERPNQKFCCQECSGKYHRSKIAGGWIKQDRDFIDAVRERQRRERMERNERLRERDAEYERNFPTTVRGGLRGRAWGTVTAERMVLPVT